MKQKVPAPRGIRNNNPLNIRIGNVWLGEVDNPTDPEFEQFCHITYGIRAACVILRRYIRHYHFDTIRLIVSRWAPHNENNTTAYIDLVAGRLNRDPDEPLRYDDKETICKLVAAMARVECGVEIREDDISRGYDMA